MRRFVWRVGLPILAFFGGGYLALHAYLSMGYANAQVEAKLRELLGAPVTVGAVRLGAGSCEVSNLTILESDTARIPLLTVGQAEADVGIADFLSGNSQPRSIKLTNPRLTIRHTRAGQLATQLPKPAKSDGAMPEIAIVNGTVVIQREGFAEATFSGVNATAKSDNGQFVLNGTVNDAQWGGTWRVSGSTPQVGGPASLQLKADRIHVTQSMLLRVPFVDPSVWEQVTLDGDTPADVQVRLGRPNEKVRYRIVLAPSNTSVFVNSIDLKAEQARGNVVVEDDYVVLRNVVGRVADGELHVRSADLDFRGVQTNMAYDFDARRLNIHRLPRSWRLPKSLGGYLSGQAKLQVRIVDGTAIPSGNGEGRVDNATLGPIPVGAYSLKFQADRNGFRFEPKGGLKLPN